MSGAWAASAPDDPGLTAAFGAIKKSSVSLEAAEKIKDLIITGELRAGDALPPERDLAVMLGISRPSVREAIRVLTAMNVVEPRHGGGTYVTSLSPRLLAQPVNFLLRVDPQGYGHLFEVHSVLGVSAARLAAQRVSGPELSELYQLCQECRDALNDVGAFVAVEPRFRERVVEATANPIYVSLYGGIANLLSELLRAAASDTKSRREICACQSTIVAALASGEGETAANGMERYVNSVRRALEQALSQKRSESKMVEQRARPPTSALLPTDRQKSLATQPRSNTSTEGTTNTAHPAKGGPTADPAQSGQSEP